MIVPAGPRAVKYAGACALHEIIRNATRLAPITRRKYMLDLDAWIEFAGNEPENWTELALTRFRDVLTAKGLMLSSIERITHSVRFALERFKAPAPHDALTADQAVALLASCDATVIGMRDRALITLGLETGLLATAMVSATVDGTFLAAAGSPTGHSVITIRRRRGEPMLVPLSKAAVRPLALWYAEVVDRGVGRPGWLFRGVVPRTGGPSGVVLRESALTYNAVSKMLASRAVAAGIGALHPQMLRNTFIAWQTAGGVPPAELDALLSVGKVPSGGLYTPRWLLRG